MKKLLFSLIVALAILPLSAQEVNPEFHTYFGNHYMVWGKGIGEVNNVRFMKVTKEKVYMYYGDTPELIIDKVASEIQEGITYTGIKFTNGVVWLLSRPKMDNQPKPVILIQTYNDASNIRKETNRFATVMEN
jgi:hypothetical protein